MIPNVGDRTNYFTMNLTQPPFDDVHVRKAMNWIVDKSALQKAWGGPIPGAIANHIVPPVLYKNGLAEYNPYATPNNAGDLAKAQAEMKLSKYDPGKTGKCTAAACKGVLVIADTRAVDTRMVPLLQADAAKIGLTLTVRSINGAYTTIQTPAKNIPMSERPSWGKDFADPGTFFSLLFHSKAIIKDGNTNYSLVGITPAIATKVGAKGNLDGRPERRPRHRQRARRTRRRTHDVLGEPGQEAHGASRSVGPVPLAEQRVHRRPDSHALELRPVHRRPRLLVGVRQE